MWETITGHSRIIALLQTMLAKRRLPHALLFAGPAGIGKSLAAKALAASLLCGSVTPCGHCLSCLAFARQSHAGLFSIIPDGSAIKIDQIRALGHEAGMGAAAGQARVCIIHDAETMTLQAANSLLKLLEEPPAQFYFILLATSSQAMLSTIVSRCLTLRFLPLPPTELAAVLVQRGVADSEAQTAARLGGGRFGQAIRLLAPGGMNDRDDALAVMETVTSQQGNWFFASMTVLEKRKSRELAELLRMLTIIFRDLAVLAATNNNELILNTDCTDKLRQAVSQWPADVFTGVVRKIRAAEQALAANANPRLTWEALLMELADLAKGGENSCRPL